LRDPDVLASIMPGGEDFAEVGENEYAGALNVKVGPVQGKFKGNIKLTDIVEPDSYTITVDGKGAPGFVKATGHIKLSDLGEQTHMLYEGTAQVGGRIASVGQRLMDTSAKSIIRQSLEALNEYLKAQVAVQEKALAAPTIEAEMAETAAKSVEFNRPSQTDVALGVAKDVADEFIPAQYRPALIAVGVVVLLIVLYLIFR
jgi:carbon monoxide dehydrogenase subunit G